MKILLTGAAGFIGMHAAKKLLERGDEVYGIDNVNDYYEVSLKEARLKQLQSMPGFHFDRVDIADRKALPEFVKQHKPQRVLHLAAQAGVRYSLTNPDTYIDSNLVGFGNILEVCRHGGVEHLAYASSSSVYGANQKQPFSIEDNVDHPVSLYAATKRANELMAYTYSHLYKLPTTGLRFFTVYGPWGRPDMAIFSFTKAILEGRPIDVFNYGKMQRDFTYIDDIVEGVVRVLDRAPADTPPYRLYNIGNNQPVELTYFIDVLEACLGRKAERRLLPMQPGDVPATFADVDALVRDVGFRPETPIEEGVRRFTDWYRKYYGVC
ncbi:MAG: NAD-dependent epimerase [Candidatus Solibacter sp.]